MAGPTPISATHLVVFHYTVAGLAHKCQMYADASPSIDPSGWELQGRVSLGNPGFSTIPDPFFTVLAPFYKSTDTSFQGADLLQRVGTAYVFLVNVPTTVAPAGGSVFQPAAGFDMVGKSTANRNMHFVIYEGPFGVSTKITSLTGQPTSVQNLINYAYAAGGTPVITDAWNWREERGSQRAQRWLSGVIDTNEKLRRIRKIK